MVADTGGQHPIRPLVIGGRIADVCYGKVGRNYQSSSQSMRPCHFNTVYGSCMFQKLRGLSLATHE